MRAPSFVLIFRFALAMALVAVVARPGRALAQTGDVRAQAETVLRRAESDDEKLELASALAGYDEGRALDPGSPRAPRAEARAAILRAHAEAHFAPYAMLERVRRDPALSSDVHAVDELVRAAAAFPPGLVRVEVWALGAEAYAHRFGRPLEAEGLLRRILVDAQAERIVAQKAARDLVTLCLGRGDLAAAEAAVHLAGTRADPQLARDVRRAVRRKSMRHTSIVALLAMVLLAARAWVSARKSGESARVRAAVASMWKVALAYAAYVALGGALLASGYEANTSTPFLCLGAVLVPILLVARVWGAVGGDSRAARAGRATLCALGALGAAFLVLEAIDVALLGGFGL